MTLYGKIGCSVFNRRYEAWRCTFVERKENRVCFLDKEGHLKNMNSGG